jgi:hypothetical protein
MLERDGRFIFILQNIYTSGATPTSKNFMTNFVPLLVVIINNRYLLIGIEVTLEKPRHLFALIIDKRNLLIDIEMVLEMHFANFMFTRIRRRVSASRLLKFGLFGTVSGVQGLVDGVCRVSLMALRDAGSSMDGSCCGRDQLWQADQVIAGHC